MNTLSDPSNLLISFFFLAQLFTISFYISSTWRKSRKVLLEKYPFDTFPNLYAQSQASELTRLSIRKWLDYAILGAGLILVATLQLIDSKQNTLAYAMILLALLQLGPMLLSAYWCQKNSQIMANRFPTKSRLSRIKSNKLRDYVSARTLLISVVLQTSAIILLSYNYLANAIALSKFQSLFALSLFVTLYIGVLMIKLFYGKKTDNFMSSEDQETKKVSKLNKLFIALGAYNCFLILAQLTALFNFNELYIAITSSVCAQLIAFSTRNQYYPISPKVYKQE